jgi:radical SAM protein with 4Fe4S-binding SPASM domain
MKQRINPFQPIYQICNMSNSKEKLKLLPTFPRCIDVELTNICNFRCLMCPTGIGSIKRKKGYMEDEVFNKILKEIEYYNTPIRLVRCGEPLLHPKLIEYIRILKSIGSIVHINTNGFLLDEDMMDNLLDVGLDSFKFSFQGVDRRSYNEMRNKDFFQELLDKVKVFYEKRGDSDKPFIQVSTTITYESSEQVKSFREKLNHNVDLLTVGRTILEYIDINKCKVSDRERSMLLYLKKQESVVKKHLECPEVFDKLSINWDGTVSACCFDYDNKMLVGDMKEHSLKQIWESQRMHEFRSLLADMRHKDLELCSACYDYHGLQTPGLQKI